MHENILTQIVNRKSELAFEPSNLDEETITSLFEAARWAPSAHNEQPWRFYYANRNNPTGFDSLLSLLSAGNKEWAQNASLLIITVAKGVLLHNGKSNPYAEHDTGLATANLLIQAEALGLSSHPMGGFDKLESSKVLGLDNDDKPLTAIAIGYKGSRENLSEANQKRMNTPRQRKPLSEIVYKM
jgi:nitroreductase